MRVVPLPPAKVYARCFRTTAARPDAGENGARRGTQLKSMDLERKRRVRHPLACNTNGPKL